MTPSKAKMVAELELLREATISDLTIKVNDPRWKACVARCSDIRKALRVKKLKKFVTQSYMVKVRAAGRL